LIEKARAPVNKAIDWVINLAVKGVKAVGKFIGGLFGKKDKDKKDTADEEDQQNVYSLAKKRLMSRLGSQTSIAQGEGIASEVLKELGPRGLRSLDLRWSEQTRSYVFDAEASPGKEIIWLAPSKKKVLMYVKVVMVGSPLEGIGERFLAESSESLKVTGGRRISRPTPPSAPRLSARDPRGHRRQSLALVEPLQGSSVLEVVSWNAGGPVEGSVVSHAETQFVEWITSRQRDPTWRARVKEVDIHISHSPCDHCAPNLAFVAFMFQNATKLQIRWDELYIDPKGQRTTSAAGLALLNKWTLIGPMPAGTAEPAATMEVRSKPT
jgi:hypothetical protein